MPGTALATFQDVSPRYIYKNAIDYAQHKRIVSGHPDGTFRPNRTINRAEFTKVVVGAVVSKANIKSCRTLFLDVPTNAWFNPYVCTAAALGIIDGYSDGTFKPDQRINFAEASKIIVNAFGYTVGTDSLWYRPYVEKLAEFNAIPPTVAGVERAITRGEMASMIWRLSAGVSNRPYRTLDDVIDGHCVHPPELPIEEVAMDEVRRVWLLWMNSERRKYGLRPLAYNEQLNRSAYEWAKYQADRNEASHLRPGQTDISEYGIVDQWFKTLGLEFANVNQRTYSENIGWGIYVCDIPDCTKSMVQTIRGIYDLYLKEKVGDYSEHYDSMMNRQFREVGMSIALSPSKKKFFMVVHFGTQIISDPEPICSN